MQGTQTEVKQFQSLHVLRGLAAVATVFWHWQHFFYIGTGTTPVPNFSMENQPLFSVFQLFYEAGWLAVDLFFSISGFIFFWLYSNSIAQGRTSAVNFTALRFSRLYPLHLASLLAVAVGQAVYFQMYESRFVYPIYDIQHFILNLFLLQSLGFESAPSYNWPAWSISVEVAAYAVFFVICRRKWAGVLLSLAISVFAFLILRNHYEPLARGFGSFFIGGLIYYFFRSISNSIRITSITAALIVITVSLWGATLLFIYDLLPLQWVSSVLGAEGGRMFFIYYPTTVLFPLTIISLVLAERCHRPMRRLSFLGDISYSIYLWHFPLQIAFVLIISALGGTYFFFTTSLSIVLFFSVLLIISGMSFHYLEMPAQRYLRAKMVSGDR